MNLNDLLLFIDEFAKQKGMIPYIVGGAVRDSFLFPDNVPEDVDLTTGDKSVYSLAYSLSKKFPGAEFKIFDDGHTALFFSGFRIDFSNNFISENVENKLRKEGIRASDLKKEVYSRDFTINTLLMNLKRDTVYDITERGVSDIKAKIIRCPASPLITLIDDPKRMLRAVKYALKFGFSIATEESRVIRRYSSAIGKLPTAYVKNIVSDILDINPKKGIEELYDLNLLKHIPLSKKMTSVLTENRELAKYFR